MNQSNKTTKKGLFEASIALFKSFGDNCSYANSILKLNTEIRLSEEQVNLLKILFQDKALFKKFDLSFDWKDKSETMDDILVDAECTHFKVEFDKYKGNQFTFFQNEHDLFKIFSEILIQGKELPELFYFIDKDYQSNSDLTYPSLEKLKLITEWLSFFKRIADIDKDIDKGIALYYLIKGEDDKYAKPLELKVTNLEELVHIEDISSVEDIAMLISTDEQGNLHNKDKQAFFKLALVDTFRNLLSEQKEGQSELVILFSNLDKIKSAYHNHYEIFIHNFALGKFQQEVEQKGFDYAEKISSVLNDIQIRLYAIPVVLISLGALTKVDNGYSYSFILLGIFITALFNHWMINDQVLRLEQIKKSSSFTFNQLKNKGAEKLEQKEVMDNLTDIISNVNGRIEDRNTKISYYKICCWIPLIFTVVLLGIKERSTILDILMFICPYAVKQF